MKRPFFIVALLAAVGLVGCPPPKPTATPVDLKPTPVPTTGDLTSKLGIEDIPYIVDDTFLGNPLGLLGQVVEIRKTGGACPTTISGGNASVEFSVEPLRKFDVDAKSVLAQPNKRDAEIVDKSASASVSFLSYLSAQLDAKSVFSIMLFDQYGARVDDHADSWASAIATWKQAHQNLFDDQNICYLWVVRGVIQKNVVRRKYTQLDAGASAGAYGINVGGKLHTGEDDYSVDVKFGLSPGILKRPAGVPAGLGTPGPTRDAAPTQTDARVLGSITKIEHTHRR